MPVVKLSDQELRALQAVFRTAEQVDWEAYDQAKAVILSLPTPPSMKAPQPVS